MNMLDQPDNICSLLSNDNREPDYNVKTRTLPGQEGLAFRCQAEETLTPRIPGVPSIMLVSPGQQGVFFRTSSILKVPKKL